MKSIVIFILISIAVSQRLTIDVYYESLCIGCQMFIRRSLADALKTRDIDKIVHIRMIPYGNTGRQQDASGNWEFDCHHGPVECYGNMIELCAQNRVSKTFPNQELPLAGIIHCIEKYLFYPFTNERFDFAVKNCAVQYKYDANDVIACASSPEGILLHLTTLNINNYNYFQLPTFSLFNSQLPPSFFNLSFRINRSNFLVLSGFLYYISFVVFNHFRVSDLKQLYPL